MNDAKGRNLLERVACRINGKFRNGNPTIASSLPTGWYLLVTTSTDSMVVDEDPPAQGTPLID
jgi:hypothetical protein